MLSDFFRITLPYGMARNKSGHWMAFNRENKPIGFNTEEISEHLSPESEESQNPVYTFFPGLTDHFIMELCGYNEADYKRDANGGIWQFWLYNDSTNPMNQRKDDVELWQSYWRKLEELARLRLVRNS